MSGPTILVADDDASVRLIVSQTLAQEGYHVRATNTMSALWRWIQAGEGDLLITDVYMPDESIFDLLPQIRRVRPDLPIIVISAQSTVLTAAMASEHGAYDYLPKPFDIDKLAETVRRALQKKPARAMEAASRRGEKDESLPLIGRSKPMQSVYRIISRVMNNDLTVLIDGESGAGKNLAARAIHQLGRRKNGPFVPVTLAALERDQVEIELFGSNKEGSGKVREADGGTLFLDEVGDLPMEAQTRLVRFLQDGRFAPTGEELDIRIIASTKHDLRALVDQGLFREDLYYRLNVVSLSLPPLRERKDDIPDLASAFLVRAKKEGLPEKQLDKSAFDLLVAYDWPGNVRELENVIRRLSALSPEPIISAREVERELQTVSPRGAETRDFETEVEALLSRYFTSALNAAPVEEGASSDIYDQVIHQVERPLIRLALAATSGNKVRAAALLGLNRNTLRSKINSLGLGSPD
ncbi:MAG: sigma 54-interacting transcriptional regulator [Hyphomonadaceae bacterium]